MSVDYISLYSYKKQYVQIMKGQPQNQNYHRQVLVSSKAKDLRVEKKQSISKKNFEVVKKDQVLQEVIELKIEDTTCQKFDEDVKEKKVELIVDNDRNQGMVIIENIVEDPIEVKYKDESITHIHQVPVELLTMTTQYVDLLGVENINFIINPLLIDVANKLKVDEKKFYATLHEKFKFLKHSNYLFIWSRRFQILTINSRTSFFQVKGSDVRHGLFKFVNFFNYNIFM